VKQLQLLLELRFIRPSRLKRQSQSNVLSAFEVARELAPDLHRAIAKR
jgi:hypothetical protein